MAALAGVPSELLPRPKRAPRTLNYVSCTFCRKSKAKCLPERRSWPEEKCRRCCLKGYDCSAPQRKNALYTAEGMISNGSISFPQATQSLNDTHNDVKRSEMEHDALVLLSLHHILDLAVAELEIVGKQLLLPLGNDHTRSIHVKDLDNIMYCYRSFLDRLRSKLEDISSAVPQILLSAALDITYVPRYMVDSSIQEKKDEVISRYVARGHYGFAYILQLQKLRHRLRPMDSEVRELLKNREHFISVIGEVLTRHKFRNTLDDIGVSLTETQLFIPGQLLKIPAVEKAVKQDSRKDCLGRSVGHIFSDNELGVHVDIETMDDRDALGRTPLHIVCALSLKVRYDRKVLKLPGTWPGHEMLGLNALHIASVHGHTDMFRLAIVSGYDAASTVSSNLSTSTGRSYLHYAARYGHLDLVEYLLWVYGRYHHSLMDNLAVCDNMEETALHLAARNGHTQVVEVIVQHTDWLGMKKAYSRYTPFWAAVTGHHLDIMKLLEPFSDVDQEGKGGNDVLTPLAEAAQQGFYEGIEYLISLGGVNINSINRCMDHPTNLYVWKTPLDLARDKGRMDCMVLLRRNGALRWQNLY